MLVQMSAWKLAYNAQRVQPSINEVSWELANPTTTSILIARNLIY